MPTSELRELWQTLDAESSQLTKTGYLLRRASSDCNVDLFLGVRCPERTRVLVLKAPLSSLPKTKELPAARGLSVFTEVLPDDDTGYGNLVVQLRDDGYREIFSTFAWILSVAACPCGTAALAVIEVMKQLFQWQQFLDAQASGLSDEAQRGLFGEMFILRALLRTTGDTRAVRAWAGPERSIHDFRFDGGLAVEIKTSITSEPQAIKINNERQLDNSNLSALYLVSLSVERLPGDGEKLPDLVTSIRALLSANPIVLDIFDSKLLLAGYLDDHNERYQFDGFAVRHERAFHVAEGFPRITEADLPEGVGRISYSVSLAACKPFSVEFLEIVNALKDAAACD
jgi:hypothetical protein